MIKNSRVLSLTEARELLKTTEREKKLAGFIKKFIKLDAGKAKKLREDLMALDLIKLKPEHISKIIDLLPKDEADIRRISELSLKEDEIQKILEITKKY